MKTKNLVLALMLAAASGAMAQNTYSGYFLEGYNYRYQMNPAFGNRTNLVGFGVGNMNYGFHGDLNLTDLVYVNNGKTVLFTNPNIPAAEVMSKIGDSNTLGTSNKLDLLAVGFKAWGGYTTVTASANINANLSLPGAFFSLAKEGVENKTYDIRNLYFNATSYATVALNHSRDITQVPGLRIGATLKGYVGMANIDARFNKAQLTLGEDAWTGTVNADVYASMLGAKFTRTTVESGPYAGQEYVNGLDFGGLGLPDAIGLGVDLGAEYKWKDFSFSAAVLDLGYMKWGKTIHATTNGDRSITTDAYTFDVTDSESFDNEFDRMKDDMAHLYQLQEDESVNSSTTTMPIAMNFGVDYACPFYRKLHFGALSSTVFNGNDTWTQVRVSANVEPVKYLSANVNFVADSYGMGMGWLLSVNSGKGINLFFGMDRTPLKLAKQFVPLESNGRFNLGFDIIF